MKARYSREISQFTGYGVVIGCSHTNIECETPFLHGDIHTFYTVDKFLQGADCKWDITSLLPKLLLSRFYLTLLENLDLSAYNTTNFDVSCVEYCLIQKGLEMEFSLNNKEQLISCRNREVNGFQNILAMTNNEGFILIVGCPRIKEYRQQIARLRLK
jgi:hypothetical protein